MKFSMYVQPKFADYANDIQYRLTEAGHEVTCVNYMPRIKAIRETFDNGARVLVIAADQAENKTILERLRDGKPRTMSKDGFFAELKM